MSVIIVRYNELGLKSPRVRRRFQKILVENIKDSFMRNHIECMIDSMWGRIIVHANEIEEAIPLLKRIFGISSISIAEEGSGGLNEIINFTLDYSDDKLIENCSFAVRTRRYGKHDFTSMDLAKDLGAAILKRYKNRNLKVNLTKPDVTIYVEVRHDRFFVFCDKISCAGGLPLGTQGKILGIFENENSLLAWWLMMKRGARVIPLFLTDEIGEKKPDFEDLVNDNDLVEKFKSLQLWSPSLKMIIYEKPLSDNYGFDQIKQTFSMYTELTREMEGRYGVDAIVSGYRIADMKDVSDGFRTIDENLNRYPVFFPLTGLTENEIRKLKENIFSR